MFRLGTTGHLFNLLIAIDLVRLVSSLQVPMVSGKMMMNQGDIDHDTDSLHHEAIIMRSDKQQETDLDIIPNLIQDFSYHPLPPLPCLPHLRYD